MTPQTYPSFERSAKWQRSFYKSHIYHIRNIKVPRNTVPSCIVHQETYYYYFYFNYYFTKIHLLKKGDQNIRVQQNNAGCRLFYRINKMKFFFYSFINFVPCEILKGLNGSFLAVLTGNYYYWWLFIFASWLLLPLHSLVAWRATHFDSLGPHNVVGGLFFCLIFVWCKYFYLFIFLFCTLLVLFQ